LIESNPYIPHVGNVCWATGMDFQEDPFPGNRKLSKKVLCSSSNVLIITDGKITLCLAKMCEVKNVKSPSNKSHDTQKKLHCSPSNFP